jgi:hypothetical protein
MPVYLNGGGTLTNLSGGLLSGGWGASSNGARAIGNAGLIIGTGLGLHIHVASISNAAGGTITGGQKGNLTGYGGTVDNLSGGTISGSAIGIQIASGTGTVINQGSLSGGLGDAIDLPLVREAARPDATVPRRE